MNRACSIGQAHRIVLMSLKARVIFLAFCCFFLFGGQISLNFHQPTIAVTQFLETILSVDLRVLSSPIGTAFSTDAVHLAGRSPDWKVHFGHEAGCALFRVRFQL